MSKSIIPKDLKAITISDSSHLQVLHQLEPIHRISLPAKLMELQSFKSVLEDLESQGVQLVLAHASSVNLDHIVIESVNRQFLMVMLPTEVVDKLVKS